MNPVGVTLKIAEKCFIIYWRDLNKVKIFLLNFSLCLYLKQVPMSMSCIINKIDYFTFQKQIQKIRETLFKKTSKSDKECHLNYNTVTIFTASSNVVLKFKKKRFIFNNSLITFYWV